MLDSSSKENMVLFLTGFAPSTVQNSCYIYIYMFDSHRWLVPNRGPIPRSRANSISGANLDRSIPQRGPVLSSNENTGSVQSEQLMVNTQRVFRLMLRAVMPGRVAQSVGHLTRKSGVLGSIPGLATYFRFSFRGVVGWCDGAG